jgi:hypothetical protein
MIEGEKGLENLNEDAKADVKEILTKRVAVIMQRRALENRWQSEVWAPVGVLCDYEGDPKPRVLVEEAGTKQWLYPGFDIVLRRAEAEGYYHNVSTQEPRVFILWRMESAAAEPGGQLAVPHFATVSYDEASRWMDGGESVDSVGMPAALFGWVGEFVEKNYRREPKKRIKPQSFLSPRDRGRR